MSVSDTVTVSGCRRRETSKACRTPALQDQLWTHLVYSISVRFRSGLENSRTLVLFFFIILMCLDHCAVQRSSFSFSCHTDGVYRSSWYSMTPAQSIIPPPPCLTAGFCRHAVRCSPIIVSSLVSSERPSPGQPYRPYRSSPLPAVLSWTLMLMLMFTVLREVWRCSSQI